MNILNRISTGLRVVALVACLVAFLLFGWSGSGWKALAIPTGSMRPNIPPGSLVLVHRVPVSSLKVGDVITHINPLNPKITITHRIIKTYKLDGKIPAFVTKGDANKTADTPVVGGEVQGKVVWHAPYAGWALLDAKKPIVILPVIYITALLIMVEEIQRLADYYRRFIIYRVPGFRRHEPETDSGRLSKRVSLGAAATTAFVLVGAAMGPNALAALRSNTVRLTDNRISVAAQHHACIYRTNDNQNHTYTKNCSQQCTSHASNNVTVQTTTTQSATTGSATSNGSTAKSDSANNTSNSSTTVSVQNTKTC